MPHSWHKPLTRQILSITNLDFTNNGASLGLNLKVADHTGVYYKFTV